MNYSRREIHSFVSGMSRIPFGKSSSRQKELDGPEAVDEDRRAHRITHEERPCRVDVSSFKQGLPHRSSRLRFRFKIPCAPRSMPRWQLHTLTVRCASSVTCGHVTALM